MKEKTVSSYISLVYMMSLNRSIFLSNAGISSSSSPFTGGQRGSVPSVPSSLRVVAVNSNRDRNGSVLTETTRKDVRDGAASSSSVIDVDSKSTVAPGGPHDVYGEDAATEEQIVTPGLSLLPVGILCCEIHTTTKDLPSLIKREQPTTCVAFFLQQSFLRNFR
ncbi:hypothetical protein NC653_004859 [Populus alba x Populus x berolinensis]|uniref:Uncharacterized protein n=1 Tax=Populus alba x Populus x berolinensis TaxID=444605 RepID=A0AAD6WKI0_9ROSI|nr:hypothetical protein NC653_004859 [Populus alba x Populus x berolinensis]